MIAQEPTLFTGTLKFNLDPFDQFSTAALEELLIKAGLSDLLNRAPEISGNDEGAKKRAESIVSSQRIDD